MEDFQEIVEDATTNSNPEQCPTEQKQETDTNGLNHTNENKMNLNEVDAVGVTSNISKEDIDEETERKLHGDAIGDTLYSAAFVAKTLLKFQDFQWSTEFEDDLCFLWDMTAEKAVCDYLIELSYPSLVVASVLNADTSSNNRFLEIIVGILGNILCSIREDEEKIIKSEQVAVILTLLDHDDPLILLQVMRLVQGLIYLSYEDFKFVDEQIMISVNFILANSMNKDLLALTLNVVAKLTEDQHINMKLVKDHLLQSTIVAYETLANQPEFDYENQQDKASTKHVIEIITNICLYIDSDKSGSVYRTTLECSEDIFKIVNSTLEYYTNDDFFTFVPDDFHFYFTAFNVILKAIGVHRLKDLLINLMKILRICVLNEWDHGFLVVTFTYVLSEISKRELEEILFGFEHLSLCISALKNDITALQMNCIEITRSLRTINETCRDDDNV